jgi:hypothetical protein
VEGNHAATAAGGELVQSDTEELAQLFDAVAAAFEQGAGYPAMARLVEGLARLGAAERGSDWILKAKRMAKRHPVPRCVFDCPFTWHSVRTPRGYPGDAQLIDFIYRHPAADHAERDTSDFGRNLLLHTSTAPPAAVRARRHLTAAYIADLVSKRPGCHVMSVACGHARELELLTQRTARRIGRFVAYDQDADSLAERCAESPST